MKLVVSFALILLATPARDLAGQEPGSFVGAGSDLPRFDLQSVRGEPFASESLSGKVGVVVFVRPGQANSLAVLRELERVRGMLGSSDWEVIAIFSGKLARTEVETSIRKTEFSGSVLLDPAREAYADFGVVALPSLAVFDGEGTVVFSHPGFGVSLTASVLKHLRVLLEIDSRPTRDDAARRSTPKTELARRLIGKGDFARAEKLLRDELREEAPLETHLQLGEVYLRSGRADRALEHLRRLERTHPGSSRVRISIARALAALGRDAEAERILLDLLPVEPKSWELHLALAELHERAGEKDLAIREYKEAISLLRESRSLRR